MSLKLVFSRFLTFNRINCELVKRRQIFGAHSYVLSRTLPSWGPPKPPTDRKDIEFRVLKTLCLHDKIDSNQLKLDSHLVNDLGLDSLDHVEICVYLEDEFKEEISDQDSEKLFTVRDIVDYLVDKKDKQVDQNQCPDIEFKEGMVEKP